MRNIFNNKKIQKSKKSKNQNIEQITKEICDITVSTGNASDNGFPVKI